MLRLTDLQADRLGPGPIRTYVAHLALRYVDWVIRHGTRADTDAWLAVAAGWRRWSG